MILNNLKQILNYLKHMFVYVDYNNYFDYCKPKSFRKLKFFYKYK